MIFEQVRAGGDRNFGYFIADSEGGFAAVVDPSGSPEMFFELIEKHGVSLKYVIITHDHSDHIGGADELARQSSAMLVLHRSAGDRADLPVDDGDELDLGAVSLKVIHTPGHTRDSICILTTPLSGFDRKFIFAHGVFMPPIIETTLLSARLLIYSP